MIYFIIFISIVLSFFLLKLVVLFAYKRKIFDKQSDRKIHHGNIPRVGGIAFVPAALISFLLAVLILTINPSLQIFCVNCSFTNELLVVTCSIIVIYLFGIYDDVLGLRYRVKFLYQILTGLFLCLAGIYLADIHGVFSLYELPPLFGFFVTIFLFVLAINAFNFIDGIDGLLSGIAILGLGYFAVVLYNNGNYFYLLAVAYLCALVPFFCFNVFGKESKRTKTFMGDTGSTVLGLLMFVLALFVNKDAKSVELYDNPFVLGFAPLLLPFYDVFSVVFFRILNSANPFKADNNHFHHKLLKLGFSQHKTLVTELVVYAVITIGTLIMCKYINLNIVIGSSIMLWIFINYVLIKLIQSKRVSQLR